MKKMILAAAAALSLGATAGAAQAQDAEWNGLYAGVFAGYTHRSESSGETVLFDRDLNGSFGDTVVTSTGANAFSTGFCPGSYLTNAAPGGCRKDDRSDEELGLRIGYDWQISGPWVVGAVGDYSRTQLVDAVTAFSTTPAAYNFTRKVTDVFGVRLRGGYAFQENLVYVTGGWATSIVKHSFRTTNTANSFTRRGGGRVDGYQYGLGVERKFTPNLSVGLEWIRTNLDDDEYRVRAGNTGATPATNPFLLGNASGTDFKRSDDSFNFNSFRVTAAWRFW
jgi:outer membrane immunogenic protein